MTLKARSDEDLGANINADYTPVFGYTDSENYYYLLTMSTAAGDTRLFRVQNGVRTELASYNGATYSDNNFHDLRIRYSGTTFEAYFDNVSIMTVNGLNLPNGKLGFGSRNDAASFDDVVITLPQASSPEDVDADGDVDTDDVNIVRDQSIELIPETLAGDVNSNGSVDATDLQQVVNNIGS